MSLYVAPGSTIYPELDGAPSGLTGTIGVRVLKNSDGSTFLARRTTGIAETPAGSGHYVATITAPTTTGEFTIGWDTGVVSPTTYVTEELYVTHTLPSPAGGSGFDLTTRAAVREFLQKQGAEVAQDGVIDSLITRASKMILEWTGREFAPATASATRSFLLRDSGTLNLEPYDLRSVSAVSVDGTSVDSADWSLRPIPARHGVYNRIKLTGYVNRRSLDTEVEVSVTGSWGFASVPDDVNHAAIVTVATWLRRDVSAFSRTLRLEEDRLEVPQALPDAAISVLAHYRRVPAP